MSEINVADKIREQGREAFRSGLDAEANPYVKDSDEWVWWREGWWSDSAYI